MVMKGFEQITSVLSKLAKGSSEETTIMETKEKSETEDETKEKAQETETETEKAETKTETEKAETETETAETKDYHIKSMKNVLKKIESLSKAMDSETTETKEKAQEDEGTEKEEETETTKSLDKFVATLEKSVDDLKEKFEKGGKRFPGLTEMIVNAIRNDEGVQKEIQAMVNEPGFKKSMSFGIPTMRTKDGKVFRLTATSLDSDEVEKSKKDNAGKTFKDVYNKNFSSSASAGE